MSFSQQIANFGPAVSKRIDSVRRGVVIKLFSAVILDTPVDTGRARGNWQVSKGAPIRNEIERDDKGGQAPISEVNRAAQDSTGDEPLFLSNNLPYIGKLEEGYSGKAPEGMVRRNVVRFGRLIRVEVSKK